MRRNAREYGPMALDRPLSFEEVARHRHVDCGRYSICLEVVVNRRWPSFTCRLCSLWHRHFGAGQTPAEPGTVLAMPLAGRR